MVKGMTGFGTAQFSAGKVKGMIEIKSFNHRYLDITFYTPGGFSSIESRMRELIGRDISRGKLTVSIKITHKPALEVVVNKAVIEQYLKYTKAFKKEFHLRDDLTIADVAQLPGAVEVKETAMDAEKAWPALHAAFVKSLQHLIQMRQREGQSVSLDIQRQSQSMQSQVRLIAKRAKVILADQKKRLTEEEFSSFQKSNDINEELARLAHFVDELKNFLKSQSPSGKNIDFIAQEMQRETNTIGSKLQDKIVATAVIALKGKIEKIREQAQNIE